MVFEEQRLARAVEKRLLVDVRARIVNEQAGFHVARGINMHIPFAARDAAATELAVVLEVNGKQRLAVLDVPNPADAVFHIHALFRRQKQIDQGVYARRHIMEIPRKSAALVDDHIEEFVACHTEVIPAGVTDRDAKGYLAKI